MKSYIEWLEEERLYEKALNIGGKSAMPKTNQAVILAGGAGCFSGGTYVKTSQGRKAIKDIVPGDIVESWNEDSNQMEWNPVLRVNVFPPVKRMMRLTFDNGEEVICSEDHEFLVDGKWVQAKDM